MFDEIAETRIKFYEFELKDLEISDEAKLLLELNDYKTMFDLLDFDLESFKKNFLDFADEILLALKKKGYSLTDFWYHNNKRMTYYDFNSNTDQF